MHPIHIFSHRRTFNHLQFNRNPWFYGEAKWKNSWNFFAQCEFWIFQFGGKLLIFSRLTVWKIHRCLLYTPNKVLNLMGGKRTTEYNRVVLSRSILLVICILTGGKKNNKMIQLISMRSFVTQIYQLNERKNKNDLLGKQNMERCRCSCCGCGSVGPFHFIPISIVCFCLKYTFSALNW